MPRATQANHTAWMMSRGFGVKGEQLWFHRVKLISIFGFHQNQVKLSHGAIAFHQTVMQFGYPQG